MVEETASPAPNYVAVCKFSSLKEGQVALMTPPSGELLIMKIQGHVYAIANRCSHQGKPLVGGRLHGHHLVCPFHAAQFDVRTGKSNGFPATRPIRTFDVRIDGDDVLVASG